MTSKPKPRHVSSSSASPRPKGGNPFKDRMGLGAYLSEPAAYEPSRVIYHTPDFVVIYDKFPKATVHTLLLPRSDERNLQHPFDAFADPDFLAKVRGEAARLKKLAAKQLRTKVGASSRAEATREAALNGEDDAAGGELPPGRDWEKEIMCGVHAVPSMSHLHVHVLSRDMHSECVKHRKHYNSFNTPFLVDLDDFPLPEDDPRRDTKREGYLQRDMKCWRCGRNFGNQFKKLKDHLEDEFQEWKRE